MALTPKFAYADARSGLCCAANASIGLNAPKDEPRSPAADPFSRLWYKLNGKRFCDAAAGRVGAGGPNVMLGLGW